MSYEPDLRPGVIPVAPADPLDVLRRMYPWAQPIEMPHTVYRPEACSHWPH